MLDTPEPVYTRKKCHGKKRRVRRFGAVVFTNKRGESKEIRPAEYLYIKNEPNTEYTKSHEDLVRKKKDDESFRSKDHPDSKKR